MEQLRTASSQGFSCAFSILRERGGMGGAPLAHRQLPAGRSRRLGLTPRGSSVGRHRVGWATLLLGGCVRVVDLSPYSLPTSA